MSWCGGIYLHKPLFKKTSVRTAVSPYKFRLPYFTITSQSDLLAMGQQHIPDNSLILIAVTIFRQKWWYLEGNDHIWIKGWSRGEAGLDSFDRFIVLVYFRWDSIYKRNFIVDASWCRVTLDGQLVRSQCTPWCDWHTIVLTLYINAL